MNEDIKSPFTLTKDQTNIEPTPNQYQPSASTQENIPVGFNLSQASGEVVNGQEGNSGLSLTKVIALFIGVYFVEMSIVVGLLFLISSISPASSQLNNTSTEVTTPSTITPNNIIGGIKTSSCQIASYTPVTADPFYDFSATLGDCDKTYSSSIQSASDSWTNKQYIQLKQFAEAAITSASNDFQRGVAHFWLGNYYYSSRDFIATKTELLQSINLAPNFADSYSLLAANFNNTKDYTDAEIYGRQCIALDNLYAYCHSNLGVALLALGKKQEGYDELNQALSLQPNNQNIKDIYNSEKAFYK